MTDIERRDELLCAAAYAELGEDAGLGSCDAQATLYAAAPGLLRECKSARLMLYAWKGERQNRKLGPHPELNGAIADLEHAIAQAERAA